MAKDTNGSAPTTTQKSSKEDLRKAFAEYDAADAALTKAESAIAAAKAKRSVTVKRICEMAGSKGPFKLSNGLVLSAVNRVNKETGEENWFFKGPAMQDVTEI